MKSTFARLLIAVLVISLYVCAGILIYSNDPPHGQRAIGCDQANRWCLQ